MRLLLTADLRYRVSWFKWLEAQAVQYEAVAISGDLLDVFHKEPLTRQAYRTTNWLVVVSGLAWDSQERHVPMQALGLIPILDHEMVQQNSPGL